jgi:hypothetical protein
MLQVFMPMFAKVDRDVTHVASVLEARCKCFKGMLQAFVQNVSFVSNVCCKRFDLDVAYVSHICHKEYVQNVSAVSVLCCNKCFHVASCKWFIWMLHMFHTHVLSICYKCFICFLRMSKCFIFRGR